MFGITGGEMLLLLFVIVVFLGPKGFKQAVDAFKKVVAWGRSASTRLREDSQINLGDMGLSELDLSDLDLKQYDPREIVRQAVREEMEAWMNATKQQPSPITQDAAPTENPTEKVQSEAEEPPRSEGPPAS